MFLRTIKLGAGVSRIEVEETCAQKVFEKLWTLTSGKRVRKHRYAIAEADLVWEIDVFTDRELVLAEVELPSAERMPEIPLWLCALRRPRRHRRARVPESEPRQVRVHGLGSPPMTVTIPARGVPHQDLLTQMAGFRERDADWKWRTRLQPRLLRRRRTPRAVPRESAQSSTSRRTRSTR